VVSGEWGVESFKKSTYRLTTHHSPPYGCRCTAEPVWPDSLSDQSETLNPDADKQVSVLLTNIWLLLGSITLGGVLKIPKALSHAGRIVSAARALLRSSQTLIRSVRNPEKRSALEKEQHAAQKSIEKMQTQVKEAAPKNPSGKTEKENLTLHGHERLQQRGISEKEVRDAIEEANRSGRVIIKMGKYGTPQTLYETENGLTVVVETSGRNTGKVITAWRKQP
jgi:hypothetical protein